LQETFQQAISRINTS